MPNNLKTIIKRNNTHMEFELQQKSYQQCDDNCSGFAEKTSIKENSWEGNVICRIISKQVVKEMLQSP